MESLRSKDRAVIEAFAEFDPAKSAGFPPSVPLTIRCVSVFAASDSQTLVYIGTGGGKIILFLLNPSSTPSSAPNPATVNGNGKDSPGSGVDATEAVEFLKAVSVHNRLIESIHVLSEIGRVLVLSGGFLFLLDLFLAQPVRKLGFVKDVTAVSKRIPCPESSSSDPFGDGVPKGEILRTGPKFFQRFGGSIRANGIGSRISEPHREGANSCIIAVAAGKRLVLIEFFLPGSGDMDSDSGGVSVLQKEILSIDGVRTMAWLGDSIIVGTSDGYTLFSASTGKSTPLFLLPDSSGPPRLKSLWRSKELLLLVDNVGVVVNGLGQPVGGSLIFQYIPESIAEMSFYVIVARDGVLDLYRKKTGAYVQSLSFENGGVGSCIVAIDDRGNGEVIVVATPYKVGRFHSFNSSKGSPCFGRVSCNEINATPVQK